MPNAISESARAQQEARHHKRIGIHDPEKLVLTGPKIQHKRWKGSVQDGIVQGDQQQA